jgi:hypothetical protein
VACAIVFFVAACAFVFADRVVVVFVDGAAGDDADLLVLAHDQAVEV